MIVRGLAIAVFALMLTVQPASAHPPPLGIGGFLGGLLHPLFVPAHLLAVIALGLLAGQQASWTRLVTFCFTLGLAAGLMVMTLGVVPAWMNDIVLSAALIGGLLVALARPVPELFGCVFAVQAGFCIALDSPPETLSLTEANLMLAGTGIGAALLLIVVSEAAKRLTRQWARIGMRVLGSWIAASAILVLVLRFAR